MEYGNDNFIMGLGFYVYKINHDIKMFDHSSAEHTKKHIKIFLFVTIHALRSKMKIVLNN